MTKTTKWEKGELLKVVNEQRQVLRCDLQRELTKKAEKLTQGISDKIELLNKQKEVLIKEKEEMLKKNDFLNLTGSRYGCDVITLNQELKTFDENTNIERKRILEA